MSTETLKLREVANRLNLSISHVRQLVKTGELTAVSRTKRGLEFSVSNIEIYASKLRAMRMDSLRKIAKASEEAGLYELD